MNSIKSENNYWIDYWANKQMSINDDPQKQVERTVNKVPIDQQKWIFTLNELERTLILSSGDTLLDLCAGNGMIAMPFALKCRAVTAVDISEDLLKKIDADLYPNVTVIVGDARKVSLPANKFSKGVMYAALQYFSEREAIGIFSTIYNSMKSGGLCLIGDIPDIDHLFDFYSKPDWVAAYFDSVKNGTPAVGTWFKKEILVKLAIYTGFSNAEIINQHPHLINSHCRFDLLLTK